MSEHAIANAKAWLETIRELAARMDGDLSEEPDAARDEAAECALSVQVRGGWHDVGAPADEHDAQEYEVLLTTGGPGLRIYGQLDRGEPDDAPHLQWQDWGVPWTDYDLSNEERRLVRIFLSAFYFEG